MRVGVAFEIVELNPDRGRLTGGELLLFVICLGSLSLSLLDLLNLSFSKPFISLTTFLK